TFTRISARLCAGSGLSSARAAASTARRASSAPLRGARPTISPEYGERTLTASAVTMPRVYADDLGREPKRGRSDHAAADARRPPEERAEGGSGEDDEPCRASGRHRRRAGHSGDERDLAEEVAGAEGVDELPFALDVGDALCEDDELLAGEPLSCERATLRQVDLVGGRGQLLRGAVLEQRNAPEQLHLQVSGHAAENARRCLAIPPEGGRRARRAPSS